MKRQAGVGTHFSVRCPCGWHGTRARSSTQPCPSCTKPIDMRQCDALSSAYAKRTAKRRATEAAIDAAIAAAAKSDRLAEEAAENERIAALLRESTADYRPHRRPTP